MHITGLQAENFKRIKYINVEIPEGKTELQIIGDNDAGKSTFMDAVEAALSGAKGAHFEPIRHGEEQATIIIKLKDKKEKLIVTKIFKKDKKPSLVIKNEDSSITFNSPQELLDSFIGALSFDPLTFYNMKPDAQYDTLKDMLKLGEIDKLEEQSDIDFTNRTLVNRNLKDKEAQLKGLGEIIILTEYIDVNKLVNKLQKINERNTQIDIEFEKHRQTQAKRIDKEKEIKNLEIKLIALKNELNYLKTEEANFSDTEKENVNDLRNQIKTAELNNKNYQEAKSKQDKQIELRKDIEALTVKSEAYTNVLAARDKRKLELLSKTEMPIPGLSIQDKIIRYEGTALQECSTSGKMKVSFAIGMALNPKLRNIFIRNASLLDNNNLGIIRDLAKEKGYAIWLELLEHKNKGKNIMQVMIENGEEL